MISLIMYEYSLPSGIDFSVLLNQYRLFAFVEFQFLLELWFIIDPNNVWLFAIGNRVFLLLAGF
jgi:hypothetical protein